MNWFTLVHIFNNQITFYLYLGDNFVQMIKKQMNKPKSNNNITYNMEKKIYKHPNRLFWHWREKSSFKGILPLYALLFLMAMSLTHIPAHAGWGNNIVLQSDSILTIAGRVTNNDVPPQPISNVSVAIKGGTVGTATDDEGRYSINAKRGDVLVFSYVGYERQEYTVTRSVTGQNMVLMAEKGMLDEVIVVGYGTQRKAHMTGSVSTVTASDLEGRPIPSLGTGLQGLVPGLTVVNATAAPGQHSNALNIRGISTWGSSSPLIVIDGVPSGNINILNPDDIESVSVLKDAAAASIYGVRGSNGVILITTKKGRGGSPSISYTGYVGAVTPTALPEMVNSLDYMTLLNEAQRNVGMTPEYDPNGPVDYFEIVRNGSDPNFFANTNWIDEIFRKSAERSAHNVNVNGGSESTNYYLSYGNLNEGGLLTGENFQGKRHNVRARLNMTLLDRLNIDANMGYVDRNYTGTGNDASNGTGPLYWAMQISPLVPVRFTTGNWATNNDMPNPVAVATDGGANHFQSQEFTGNLSASLEVLTGLTLKGQYGLVRSNSRRDILRSTLTYYHPDDNRVMFETNAPNFASATDYTGNYQTFIGTAEYKRTLNEDHNITGLLGYSLEKTIGTQFTASRQDIPIDMPAFNLGLSNTQNSASGNLNALMSVFGRANYAYKDRYLTEVNFRRDGSSRFAPEHRWNTFASVSLGWAFSEEKFFDGLRDVIQLAKIRASYGTQGNDNTGQDFPYLSQLTAVQPGSMMPIGNLPITGFRHTVAANYYVTWESATKRNLGLDLTMLNQRFTFTGELFSNQTNGLLINPVLPSVFGYRTNFPPENQGKIANKGWEVQAGWRDNINDFRYGFNVNLSDVRNKVLEMGNHAANLGTQVRLEGYPLNAFYGLIAEGLAQEADFDYNPANGQYTAHFPVFTGDIMAPGDVRYRDVDESGAISNDDRQVIGSNIPRYTYGVRGDFGYKNFDLSFFLQGVGKADGYISGPGRHAFTSVSERIPQTIHLDRWTPDNPNASYPRLAYLLSHNTRFSTHWLEDASYLRLKNLQVGYTLPESLTSRARISRARIYFSADNLFTLTDYFYGYDPEVTVSSGGYYPQVKTYTFGINVNLQ